MSSKTLARLLILAAIAAVLWLGMQFYRDANQQLSVKPARSSSDIKLEPVESNIGLQTHIPFQTIISAAESATLENETGTGEKQTCKKLLGAKVCATLHWQYKIGRDGDIELVSTGDRLQLSVPISFSGVVSVDGNGGKLLGLRNKDIDGKLNLLADLNINIGSNWCPSIDSKISYQWISDPRIRILGNIRVNLKKSVDKALQGKLNQLQSHLAEAIDCEALRKEIAKRWHTHTVKVPMTTGTYNWLHVKPINASVSDVAIDVDQVRLSFELGAEVELLPHNTSQTSQSPLPDLQPYTQTPGSVEFSLLMEIPYQQLSDTLSDKLAGKPFGDKNSFTITSIDVYPSGQLLSLDIGFSANAAGNLFTTNGNVYISAKPVADPVNNTLQLSKLELTRTIDSRLMSALTTVLRKQLLQALEKESLIDLGPPLEKIENSITEALSDPTKTAGIEVTADSPDVRLMRLNPQTDGLAAIIHLSTRLNARIPETVLVR